MSPFLWKKRTAEQKTELRHAVDRIRFRFTALGALADSDSATIKPAYSRVATSTPFELLNGIFLPRFPSGHAGEEALREALAPFQEARVPALICVDPQATPGNLDELLLRNRCRYLRSEFDLGVDTQSFRIPRFLFNRVSLKLANTDAEKREWCDLFFANFDLPDFAKEHFLKMIQKEPEEDLRLDCFFGMNEGRAVGTIALAHQGDMAGLYCVSIKPELRKSRWGAMMLAALYRAVQNEPGARFIIGNSNEAGYKLYTKAPTVFDLGQTRLYQFDPS